MKNKKKENGKKVSEGFYPKKKRKKTQHSYIDNPRNRRENVAIKSHDDNKKRC